MTTADQPRTPARTEAPPYTRGGVNYAYLDHRNGEHDRLPSKGCPACAYTAAKRQAAR